MEIGSANFRWWALKQEPAPSHSAGRDGGPCSDLSLVACTDDVTGAIWIGAEEGSAGLDFLVLSRFGRVERHIWSMWITNDDACRDRLLVIVGGDTSHSPIAMRFRPYRKGHTDSSELRNRSYAHVVAQSDNLRARLPFSN